MINMLLKNKVGQIITIEIISTIIGNVFYKGYKEYCKSCWNKFYKK